MKKARASFFAGSKILLLLTTILLISFCRQVNKNSPGISTRQLVQASTDIQTAQTPSSPPKNDLRGNIGEWFTVPCEYKKRDTIVLSWDASVNYLDTVRFYILSYLNDTNANATWLPLKDTVWAPNHQDTIYRKDVTFGKDSIFYFRVQSVTQEGVSSDWHESYETSAFNKGWKLCWGK